LETYFGNHQEAKRNDYLQNQSPRRLKFYIKVTIYQMQLDLHVFLDICREKPEFASFYEEKKRKDFLLVNISKEGIL